MAKVVIEKANEPSVKSSEASSEIIHVTDSRNRRLGLKKPDFLEEFRIIEAVGSETAENTTYMAMLNPLLYLVEIDGEPIMKPKNKLQAEALIQRAGREGFMAVMKGLKDHFSDAQMEEQVKNLLATPASETVAGS